MSTFKFCMKFSRQQSWRPGFCQASPRTLSRSGIRSCEGKKRQNIQDVPSHQSSGLDQSESENRYDQPEEIQALKAQNSGHHGDPIQA